MRRLKKTLGWLLAVCMLLSLLPISALAAYGDTFKVTIQAVIVDENGKWVSTNALPTHSFTGTTNSTSSYNSDWKWTPDGNGYTMTATGTGTHVNASGNLKYPTALWYYDSSEYEFIGIGRNSYSTTPFYTQNLNSSFLFERASFLFSNLTEWRTYIFKQKAPPQPSFSINSLSKDLVESETGLPNFVNIPQNVAITYPDSSGKVIIPEGESVTLLYCITVKGDAGAAFTVTDKDAKLAGSNCEASQSGDQFSGTVPSAGTALIYVYKSFDAEDIDQNGKLTNTANLSAGDNTTDKSGGSATETTPAEPGGGDQPGPDNPPPNPDKDFNYDLIKVKVNCDCENDPKCEHATKEYGLLEGAYTVGESTWNETASQWEIEVTISGDQAETYLEKAKDAWDGNHTWTKPETVTAYILVYDLASSAWIKDKNSTSTVEYDATCVHETESPNKNITGFEKKLVEKAEEIPDGITIPDGVTYPDPVSGTVTVPQDGSVTLLYCITVSGEAGAAFTITDEGATLAGSSCGATQNEETDEISGTIPEDGSAVIYVYKTFTAEDIDSEKSVLTNTATLTAGEDTENNTSGTATEETPAVPGGGEQPETPPTKPDNDTVEGLLRSSVQITDVYPLESHRHDSARYGLIDNSYTVGEVAGNAATGYTCAVTIQADPYVSQYSTEKGITHRLMPGESASKTVTLNWTGATTGWQVASRTPVTFQVECDLVTIEMMDLTAYSGGDGYGSVVTGESGIGEASEGFPVPGCHITLPGAVNDQLGGDENPRDLSGKLILSAGDQKWTIQRYGGGASMTAIGEDGIARYVYQLVPDGDSTDDARVTYTKGGQAVASDDIADFAMGKLYETYTVSLYGGLLDTGAVTAQLAGLSDVPELDMTREYQVDQAEGTLTVRGVDDSTPTLDTPVAANTNDLEADITAVGNDVAYYVNESQVEVDADRVELLTDGILETGELAQYLADQGHTDGQSQVIYQYLDLVDSSNGRTHITLGAEDSLDIYWKLPEGADPNTVKVVHFDGLDRNYDHTSVAGLIGNEGYEVTVYSLNDTENGLSIETIDGAQYVKFQTRTFSPFALVYDGEGGEDPDTYTLTYHASYGRDETETYTYAAGATVRAAGRIFDRDGYILTGWNTEEDGTGTPYDRGESFPMPARDMHLYAQWTRDYSGGDDSGDDDETYYHIKVTIGRHGDITPDGGINHIVTVAEGNDKTFRIQADEGYQIVDVLVDGRSVGPRSSYTFENVKRDHTIEAVFDRAFADPDDTGVSRWLNTDDHDLYMVGYPDGTFGPDRNMTRAEAAVMFYALLNDQNVTITRNFSDVPADAWYTQAVNTLGTLGMIAGYEDGTFRPNNTITRAEFATMAVAFTTGLTGEDCGFSDVHKTDWFYSYVAQAASCGWISDQRSSQFRPADRITRAEVSEIVNKMLGRAADQDYVDEHVDDLITFTDVPESYWAYYSIMETTNSHDYDRDNGIEEWTGIND